jgi:5,10-methylenetetrahydrofolate reductase
MKVTDALKPAHRRRPVFIADFSPPRGPTTDFLDDAMKLIVDFIAVAYNPGKAVRIDSVSVAHEIKRVSGRETIFNLSPRDMNRIAVQSRLLGGSIMGLSNVLVVQGDPLTERDRIRAATGDTATSLIADIAQLNLGLDYKGLKLRAPTDICIGASVDLGKGIEAEARLAQRKVEAGAHFLVTQPIFDAEDIARFEAAYASMAGAKLGVPVFWGLQILVADGVLFSNVPASVREQLEGGRSGVEIALEQYERMLAAGVQGIYLVAPIIKGGARDYDAAADFLARAGE